MEAMVYSTELLSVTIATGGLLALLAVAMAGILFFGYVADEEAMHRRIEWLEEPLAMAGQPVPPRIQVVELRKAA